MVSENQGSSVSLPHLVEFYNPWWQDPTGTWRKRILPFERPVVDQIWGDMEVVAQIVSVTGPRRVGKTTILRQLIARLLVRKGVAPNRILYMSMDDPELLRYAGGASAFLSDLLEQQNIPPDSTGPPHYVFLDEIQRVPDWELHLKKYYDRGFPIRFVVSGSASAPILRQSRESLAGRILDRRVLPFSFREFCLFRLQTDGSFGETLKQYAGFRERLLRGEGADGAASALSLIQGLASALVRYTAALTKSLTDYWREGGFPEVWELQGFERKQEYLWDSVVRKMIHDDFAPVAKYRKPENIDRLILYLLSHPGMELNVARIAKDAGLKRQVVEENLPYFEQADLVRRVRKFRADPFRPREGNMKCYVTDLALTNAVLKAWNRVPVDRSLLGLYAENTVANLLLHWREAVEVTYYRDKNREVDFIVTHGGGRHLPLEVKSQPDARSLQQLERFLGEYRIPFGVLLTGERPAELVGNILLVPLRYFLLIG